jgi:hypothetical protein
MSIAGVAQLAEQLICNQQVAGSSPIASSNVVLSNIQNVKILRTAYGGMAEWLKAADCKSARVRVRRFESFSLHRITTVTRFQHLRE